MINRPLAKIDLSVFYLTYDKHVFGLYQGVKGDVRNDLATVGAAVLKIHIMQNHRVSCR